MSILLPCSKKSSTILRHVSPVDKSGPRIYTNRNRETRVKNNREVKKLERRFVTINEAAIVLGVSKQSLYRAINRGEIPAVHIGAAMRISITWLKDLEQRAQVTQ